MYCGKRTYLVAERNRWYFNKHCMNPKQCYKLYNSNEKMKKLEILVLFITFFVGVASTTSNSKYRDGMAKHKLNNCVFCFVA